MCIRDSILDHIFRCTVLQLNSRHQKVRVDLREEYKTDNATTHEPAHEYDQPHKEGERCISELNTKGKKWTVVVLDDFFETTVNGV